MYEIQRNRAVWLIYWGTSLLWFYKQWWFQFMSFWPWMSKSFRSRLQNKSRLWKICQKIINLVPYFTVQGFKRLSWITLYLSIVRIKTKFFMEWCPTQCVILVDLCPLFLCSLVYKKIWKMVIWMGMVICIEQMTRSTQCNSK